MAEVEHPRDDLIRMSRHAPAIKDGRTIFGMVVAYNEPAEVRSWEGHFTERIMPGAATKTVAETASRMKVLFNHGLDSRIGEWPLGKPSIIEERSVAGLDGVYAEVPIAETSYGDDILALVDAGAIDGWSFRFSVPKGKDTWHRPSARGELSSRDVHEMRMPEFGPVTFPVYEASTMGVRSQGDFHVWQQLSPKQRASLRSMMEQSTDLGTSLEEAVDNLASQDEGEEEEVVTSETEAASGETTEPTTTDTTPIEEPEVESHSGLVLTSSARQKYVRLMQAERLLHKE